MNLTSLVQSSQQTHTAPQQRANKAINSSLSIRNSIIDFYIVEFEQKGENPAKYFDKLLQNLANGSSILHIPKLSNRHCTIWKKKFVQNELEQL
jgi:hypothetical protein